MVLRSWECVGEGCRRSRLWQTPALLNPPTSMKCIWSSSKSCWCMMVRWSTNGKCQNLSLQTHNTCMSTISQSIGPIGNCWLWPVFHQSFHVLKNHMDWQLGSHQTPRTKDCGLVQNGCGPIQLPVFGQFWDQTFKHYEQWPRSCHLCWCQSFYKQVVVLMLLSMPMPIQSGNTHYILCACEILAHSGTV